MIFYVGLMYFFFFKQKTAYEMRISDWSSDVCSSDLRHTCAQARRCFPQPGLGQHLQRGDGQAMRPFGVEAENKRANQTVRHHSGELWQSVGLGSKPAFSANGVAACKIGRASCRERWDSYV